MPSSFSGMDPYLEGKEWSSFHIELSSAVTRALIPELRPRYYARTMPRFITDWPEGTTIVRRDIYPDVGVTLRETAVVWNSQTDDRSLQLKTVIPQKTPHYVVEIYDRENDDLVTAIEILSPANKRGKGYEEYVAKRERILQSSVHLVEIDLLRRGRRVPMVDPLPDAPYFIFLSRVETRPVMDVWPVLLSSSLPVIPIPLLAEDEDVLLDLQAIFTAVYDALDYASLIDYNQPPEIPLAGEMAVWAATRLQSVAGNVP